MHVCKLLVGLQYDMIVVQILEQFGDYLLFDDAYWACPNKKEHQLHA